MQPPQAFRSAVLAALLTGSALAGGPASAASPTEAPPASTSATPASTPELAPIERAPFDLARAEIRSFIDEMVAQGLARERVSAILGAAESQPKIIDAITRPAEKTLQWWEYRGRMLTPARIESGVQLWREHKELLDAVATEYEVPPEYVLAVLGVETQYGRVTGRYRVIDALATLAFDYPPRAAYFRKELGEFLLLTHEEQLDPLGIHGSYAGAMGALQFMPSSYRKFAVSEEHSARRDLWGDWGDIFASTANYLHQAGWQYGAAVLAEARSTSEQPLAVPDHIALSDTLGKLRERGLAVASTLPDDTPALLIAAPEQDAMGYRIGFQNFYVITRYNSSPLYAMAVHDLAQAIRQQLTQEAAL